MPPKGGKGRTKQIPTAFTLLNTSVVNGIKDLYDGMSNTYDPRPTASVGYSIASTSTQDAANGSGAKKLSIQYQDGQGVTRAYDVTLTGTTPVVLPVNRYIMVLLSAECDAVNVGDIKIYTTLDVLPQMPDFVIPAGQGKLQNLTWATESRGDTVITSAVFTSTGEVEIKIQTRLNTRFGNAWLTDAVYQLNGSPLVLNGLNLPVYPRRDLRVRATSQSSVVVSGVLTLSKVE